MKPFSAQSYKGERLLELGVANIGGGVVLKKQRRNPL